MEDPVAMMQSFQEDADAALMPLVQAATELSGGVAGNNSSSVMNQARGLVLKACADGHIFAGFDQLKDALSAVTSDQQQQQGKLVIDNTLDLFSYGVLHDYNNASRDKTNKYLDLNAKHILKLRQLTVISVVQEACHRKMGFVPYADFAAALDLQLEQNSGQQAADKAAECRAVEEILLSCLYVGIIQGQLCQKTKRLVLVSDSHQQQPPPPPCRPRDVSPEQVTTMLQQVEKLQDQIQQSVVSLQEQKNAVGKKMDEYDEFVKNKAMAMKKAAEANSSGSGGSNTRGAVSSSAAWVDPSEAARRQKRSRGGPGTATDSFNFRSFQL